MKTNSFFAPSITLENGTSILTGETTVEILFADGEIFSYRASGGSFDEVNTDSLSYEKLIAILSGEGLENEILEVMLESMD